MSAAAIVGGATLHSGSVSAQADVNITKTDGVSTVNAGGSVTYTITVTNPSAEATTATVSDLLPPTLTSATWTCVGAGGGICAASGTGDIVDNVTLPAASSVTYTVNATVSNAAVGTLSNTATVAALNDPNSANDSATDADTIVSTANLAITKTDGVVSAVPGGPVTYTITASNSGPNDAVGTTVVDDFPASLTTTWTCVGAGGGTCTPSGSGDINAIVNLPNGGSVTYTVSATISAGATGTLVNTATVAPAVGVDDPDGANNSATDTDTLTPQADLQITKTDGVASAVPGGSVTYTITASNPGPSDAPGATVADTFPGVLNATWTCVGAGGGSCTASGSGNINDTVNLPAGGSVTYTATATVHPAATGTVVNTATVTPPAGVIDLNPGNNSATDADTLTPQADLQVIKTDGVADAVWGGIVTYTITVTNAGPSNAPGAMVADPIPANVSAFTWTCVGAGGGTCTASGSGSILDTVNLPAGGSVTYTVTAQLVAGTGTSTLVNTATASPPAGVTDANPVNNAATDNDAVSDGTADLTISKDDAVTTAVPGGATVTYTITATNSGPANAPGATVADDFPASLTVTWTCVGAGGGTCTASGSGDINDTVNLPAGGSVTYTAIATINAGATGTLANTATVTPPAGVTETAPGDNTDTDTDTLTPQADLQITKTDGVTTAVPGGATVTYTITATNAGPSNAPGVTVADDFPASLTVTWTCVGAGGGTCTASGSGDINDTVNLPAGGSVIYTAIATIDAGATGTLVNTATIAAPAGVTDTAPVNNSATDTDTLTPQADLTITKTGPASAAPGADVSYTITASNAGPSAASNVVLTDALPAGVTFVSITQNTGPTATLTTPAVGGTGSVIATWTTLASGASASFTLTVNVGTGVSGDLSNTATIASPTADTVSSNNSGSLAVAITTSTTSTTTTTTSTTLPSTTTTTTIPRTTTTVTGVVPATGGGSPGLGLAALALLAGGAALIAIVRRSPRHGTTT